MILNFSSRTMCNLLHVYCSTLEVHIQNNFVAIRAAPQCIAIVSQYLSDSEKAFALKYLTLTSTASYTG